MEPHEWDAVARLICDSTNHWYQTHGMGPIFSNGSEPVMLFCQVYEHLDPGCCLLAVDAGGAIAGSCFYHPRSTHVSLGIMNVGPGFASQGVAKLLLNRVISIAESLGKPLRLVSSAMNLDSYSLYTKAGLVPRLAYQDMTISVPEFGFDRSRFNRIGEVRAATLDDVEAMVALELEVSGISRQKDFAYFIENELQCWRTLVLEEHGKLVGFLTSIQHPASNMLGPGVMKTEKQAVQLILEHLDCQRGNSPVFLVPVECSRLVQEMYQLGARNCEIHFAQSLGEFRNPNGVTMPTFMPETG